MDNYSAETIAKLEKSIAHLEVAVFAARERLAQKFGVKHPTVMRLNEYLPSIQEQRKYIEQLQEAIKIQNFDEVSRLVVLINSISYMIKDDARDVLLEMQGIACEIDKDVLH